MFLSTNFKIFIFRPVRLCKHHWLHKTSQSSFYQFNLLDANPNGSFFAYKLGRISMYILIKNNILLCLWNDFLVILTFRSDPSLVNILNTILRVMFFLSVSDSFHTLPIIFVTFTFIQEKAIF